MNETILKKLRDTAKCHSMIQGFSPNEASIILGALGYPKRPTDLIDWLRRLCKSVPPAASFPSLANIEVLLDYIEELEESK